MTDANHCHREEGIYRHAPCKTSVKDKEKSKTAPEQDSKDMTQEDWHDYVDGRMGQGKHKKD
ncbi:hypothetical protein KIH87_02235 [Paraneptunicella aestuarii]|uniref:hypothetical protein n=1 Tax=Paraneptunicella aestuarii TaxID=2831148 RepID=UPI001E520B67|nr:hypothetical protein [Paraneptunicella aestuarii]UAA39203.1 hypothetical protein KIH87_02235 [Paraneptunicella aestuarii]